MSSLFKITYGLYILTAKTNKFNGCVINTLMQVTSSPARISITINKDNFTTKMIQETGEFNVSVLDNTTPFSLIQNFGFSSGKDTDKFQSFKDFNLAKNNIPYITSNTNAYFSAKVISVTDVGTHLTFVADIVEDGILSAHDSLTYSYYISNIKPKPEAKKKKQYVCRICGYVYEGDELPADFICPICKHSAQDFELIEEQETKSAVQNSTTSQNQFYCPICGNIEKSDSNIKKCVICGANMVKF